MWTWLGLLLTFLGSWKKLWIWLLACIPSVTHAFGWVGRLWNAVRNTAFGRLLRMAGMLSVAGALALACTRAVFAIFGELVQSTSIGFSWPSNSFIHSMVGLVNVVFPLDLLLDLLVYWVYASMMILAIRMGKYIISLTIG